MPHPLPSPPPLSALNLEHSPASSSQLVLTHRNADRRSNAEIPSIVFSPTPVTHFDEQDELAFPILPTPSTSRSRVHSDSSLLLPEPPKPGGRSTSTPARKDQSSAPSPARTTPSPSHARQPPNAALTSRTDKGKAADHSPAVSHLRPPTSNATASPRPPVQNPSSPTPTRETRTRASSKNRRSWILKGDGAALPSLMVAIPTLVAPSVGAGWTPESPLDSSDSLQNDPPSPARPTKWWKPLESTVRRFSPCGM